MTSKPEQPLPERPSPAVSEDDREGAVRRLQDAYAEGHLSHEEMDATLQRVLTVTTHDGLVAAVAHLPALPAPAPETSATIGAASGRITRRGAWRVPRHLTVESAFGSVRLDLSEAVLEHREVDIELRLGTGRAAITVPRDATVELEGLRTVWKDTRYEPPRRAGAGGGPVIRISGTIEYGRLTVRHARR